MTCRNLLTVAFGVAVVLAISPRPVAAQDTPSVNAEVIGLINGLDEKVTALAGAMNEDQWAWRPMEGVRSTNEVVMHIAFANFFIPSMLGAQPPEDFPVTTGPDGLVGAEEYEATTNRADVLAALDASFDHVRAALAGVSPERMNDEMNFFGETMTVRGFCTFMATHLHEHLGQLIAYARTNGVVPPWTADSGN